MKHRLGILFLFLSVFVLLANRVWACSSDNTEHTTKFHQESSAKSCCSKNDDQTACASDSEHEDPRSNCPCDHDSNGCHCPGCVTVCHSAAAFTHDTPSALVPDSNLNASVQKQAFYFAEYLPEAVYLPIWQPPKWVA